MPSLSTVNPVLLLSLCLLSPGALASPAADGPPPAAFSSPSSIDLAKAKKRKKGSRRKPQHKWKAAEGKPKSPDEVSAEPAESDAEASTSETGTPSPPDPVEGGPPGTSDSPAEPAPTADNSLPPGDAIVVQPPNTWMGATLTFLGSLAGGLLCASCPLVFVAVPCCPWAGYALPPTMACGSGCGAGLAAAGTEMGADEPDAGRVLAPLLVAFGVGGAASLLPWVGAMAMTMLATSPGAQYGGSSTSTYTLFMNAGLIGLFGLSALVLGSAAAAGAWVAARGDPHVVVEAHVKKKEPDQPTERPSGDPSTKEAPQAPTTAMAF